MKKIIITSYLITCLTTKILIFGDWLNEKLINSRGDGTKILLAPKTIIIKRLWRFTHGK